VRVTSIPIIAKTGEILVTCTLTAQVQCYVCGVVMTSTNALHQGCVPDLPMPVGWGHIVHDGRHMLLCPLHNSVAFRVDNSPQVVVGGEE